MNSTAIATVVKMMERLPAPTQEQVVDHLREYLADLEDETLWDEQFTRSQEQLSVAAGIAREEINAERTEPLDLERL